jgi:hypothetical protein
MRGMKKTRKGFTRFVGAALLALSTLLIAEDSSAAWLVWGRMHYSTINGYEGDVYASWVAYYGGVQEARYYFAKQCKEQLLPRIGYRANIATYDLNNRLVYYRGSVNGYWPEAYAYCDNAAQAILPLYLPL